MHKKTFIPILTVLAVLLLVGLACAQYDIKELLDPAFPEHERPAVPFDHEAHNEQAELMDDCAFCHHDGADGQIDPDSSSEGIPCAECHPVQSDDPEVTGLTNAYHGQCITCHEDKGAGPVACGECHVRK